MVQPLLAQPLRLASRVQRRERQTLALPAEHVRVQLQREAGLRIVLRLHVQRVQLVDVAQVHLAPVDLVLVEVQQIDGARHALVAVLLALHHAAVVQQALQQPRHRCDEGGAGHAPRRILGGDALVQTGLGGRFWKPDIIPISSTAKLLKLHML